MTSSDPIPTLASVFSVSGMVDGSRFGEAKSLCIQKIHIKPINSQMSRSEAKHRVPKESFASGLRQHCKQVGPSPLHPCGLTSSLLPFLYRVYTGASAMARSREGHRRRRICICLKALSSNSTAAGDSLAPPSHLTCPRFLQAL
eukprot:871629-Pelagomonas_calceolata.AAC.1